MHRTCFTPLDEPASNAGSFLSFPTHHYSTFKGSRGALTSELSHTTKFPPPKCTHPSTILSSYLPSTSASLSCCSFSRTCSPAHLQSFHLPPVVSSHTLPSSSALPTASSPLSPSAPFPSTASRNGPPPDPSPSRCAMLPASPSPFLPPIVCALTPNGPSSLSETYSKILNVRARTFNSGTIRVKGERKLQKFSYSYTCEPPY